MMPTRSVRPAPSGRPPVVPLEEATAVAAAVLGGPIDVEVLKDKPGRRRTFRARGRTGSAIVKTYASGRAATVAARIGAIADGPIEPAVPRVLHLDVDRRLVVLSDLPGTPLRIAAVGGDLVTCRRAGAALATWHLAGVDVHDASLREHTVERELAILRERAAAPGAHPAAVAAIAALDGEPPPAWPCPTVVHRDLYEEQILTGEVIGLIDLDDVHRGPPELDVGNLLAHLSLLASRGHPVVADAAVALLDGYARAGGDLDPARLAWSTRLSALRLGCIHALDPATLPPL